MGIQWRANVNIGTQYFFEYKSKRYSNWHIYEMCTKMSFQHLVLHQTVDAAYSIFRSILIETKFKEFISLQSMISKNDSNMLRNNVAFSCIHVLIFNLLRIEIMSSQSFVSKAHIYSAFYWLIVSKKLISDCKVPKICRVWKKGEEATL